MSRQQQNNDTFNPGQALNIVGAIAGVFVFPSTSLLHRFGTAGDRFANPVRVIGGGVLTEIYFAERNEPFEAMWFLYIYIVLLVIHRVAMIRRGKTYCHSRYDGDSRFCDPGGDQLHAKRVREPAFLLFAGVLLLPFSEGFACWCMHSAITHCILGFFSRHEWDAKLRRVRDSRIEGILLQQMIEEDETLR